MMLLLGVAGCEKHPVTLLECMPSLDPGMTNCVELAGYPDRGQCERGAEAERMWTAARRPDSVPVVFSCK